MDKDNLEHLLTMDMEIEIRSVQEIRGLSKLDGYDFDDRYGATPDGTIYRIRKRMGNVFEVVKMRPYITKDKYLEYVLVNRKGKKTHIQGQRIIAGLYLVPDPNKKFVNHKDLNRSNNNVHNLEWVTHSENIKHSWAMNLNRKPRTKKIIIKRK